VPQFDWIQFIHVRRLAAESLVHVIGQTKTCLNRRPWSNTK